MTSKVTIHLMKNLRLHNVSIHRNFYQNRLIYKCVKKSLAKIPGSQSFFVRCRRTVILTNIERGTVYCICLVVARLRTVIKTSICISKLISYFLVTLMNQINSIVKSSAVILGFYKGEFCLLEQSQN